MLLRVCGPQRWSIEAYRLPLLMHVACLAGKFDAYLGSSVTEVRVLLNRRGRCCFTMEDYSKCTSIASATVGEEVEPASWCVGRSASTDSESTSPKIR
jgi:hypothetical protein